MKSTLRTLAIMLLMPPLVLVAWAHALPGSMGSEWVALPLLIALIVAGLVAVATSRWPPSVKAVVAIVYALAAIPLLPFMTLVAVCSTGDCL